MTITCIIRYQIDYVSSEYVQEYAENGGDYRGCGGAIYRLLSSLEGTNDVGGGLIAFDRSRLPMRLNPNALKADPEAREKLAMAQSKRFILRDEERKFVEVVDGTLGIP